jgi:hypothetical protein
VIVSFCAFSACLAALTFTSIATDIRSVRAAELLTRNRKAGYSCQLFINATVWRFQQRICLRLKKRGCLQKFCLLTKKLGFGIAQHYYLLSRYFAGVNAHGLLAAEFLNIAPQ